MKFFGIALLAVAASAVSIDQTSSRLETAVRGSAFGQNVLAELQSKLATGSPVQELEEIIQEIKTRLAEAQTEDGLQNDAHKAQCASDISKLNEELTRLAAQIAEINADIQSTNSQIQITGTDILRKKADIEQDKQDITDTEDRITTANEARRAAKELYDNRTRDTKECQEAITEIEALDGLDGLEAGQGDHADIYNGNREYAALLEKTAARVTDPTAKSLVQLAAISAQGLSGGDVTRLKELLAQLRDELTTYQTELNDGEAQSIADYNALIAAEELTLLNQKSTLKAHERELEALEAREQKEIGHRNQLNSELAATTQDETDTNAVKSTTETKCQDLNDAYAQRSQERTEEQITLGQIEQIIRDKLQTGKMAGHVEDRVDGVTIKQ